jgi:hypothetical protein
MVVKIVLEVVNDFFVGDIDYGRTLVEERRSCACTGSASRLALA